MKDDNFVVEGIHRDGNTPVGNVLKHRRTVLEAIAGYRIDLDLSVTLIDAVRPVTPIIGNDTSHDGSDDEPVEVPHNGIEDILRRKGVGIFFLQKGEVGILVDG